MNKRRIEPIEKEKDSLTLVNFSTNVSYNEIEVKKKSKIMVFCFNCYL